MRRRWWALAAAAVVAGACLAGGGAAAKPGGRTVVESYTPTRLSTWRVHYAAGWFSVAEIPLRSRDGETSVTIRLEDEAGMPVHGSIEQDGMPYRYFCGTTTEPLEIVPLKEFYVIASSGTCDGSPSVATAGTATITFHRARGGSR